MASAPAGGAALVTGAGRGLGLEIARALAARGYAVHVTDVDEGAATAAAAKLGEHAWGSRLDVADADACRAAARATAERGGSLGVWVNNAGILPTGLSWEHDAEVRRRTLEINALGVMNGTVAALELMRPADRGHVITIVSLAGIVAAPGETLYSASKHAAMAFTLGTLFDLRRSGVKNVHVTAVCPDGIWTPMLHEKADDPEAWASWSGVMLKPEEVAARAVAVLDKPRPVVTMPRWRGAAVRAIDLWPAAFLRLQPLVIRDALRKQSRWRRRHARDIP
jgi:NAD(P)-dependent dehydrogenase (short-subunit alcohol dehydrogenase family)